MTNETQAKPTDQMTVAELRGELEEGGLTVPGDAKKADLARLVDRARADAEPGDEEAGEIVAEEDEPAAGTDLAVPEPEPAAEVSAEEVVDEVARALALREQTATPTHALPSPAEYNVLGLLANRTYQTTFVPAAYRGREADVFAAFLFGREIGLGPMMALRDVYMIDGRPALAAHRQLAKLREGGVVILESEATRDRAYIKARRQDTGEVMAVEFTYEEAELVDDGKLVAKKNWRSWRSDMLWARCVGRLTRRFGPDLLGGLPPYVAEEVADFSGWGVEYGAEGEVRLEAPRNPEPVRVDPSYNVPGSWAELAERLGLLLGPEEAREWVAQSIAAAYGGKATGELSTEERAGAFQKACAVLHAFDTDERLAGDLHLASRGTLAGVFARFFGGELVEGPRWALTPEEAGSRPSREEALGRPGPESPVGVAGSRPEASEGADGAEGAPGGPSGGEAAPGMRSVDDIEF